MGKHENHMVPWTNQQVNSHEPPASATVTNTNQGRSNKGVVSQMAQWQRIRLPIQETWVPSLVQEDHLEKELATHSSILAWEIPGTEKPSGLQSTESPKSQPRLRTKLQQQKTTQNGIDPPCKALFSLMEHSFHYNGWIQCQTLHRTKNIQISQNVTLYTSFRTSKTTLNLTKKIQRLTKNPGICP